MIEPDAVSATPIAVGAGVPDPHAELRMRALSATRGANFWSRRPVTRLDVVVGAYDDLSSADVAGFTDRLVRALPGLEAHRCSIGERGGFITRLIRGTYAAHIVEHVALELQSAIGHRVGYGRSRAGDVDGEYTVVFEHAHEATGLRAAALALGIVQQAFAGTLESVEHALAELRSIASAPDVAPLTPHVRCAVTGSAVRTLVRSEIARRLAWDTQPVVEVSPSYILQAGLPYATSDLAVVTDADLTEVPARYRDPERARRLVATLFDALPRGAVAVLPAKAWQLQDAARSARCAVAIFSGADDVTAHDRRVARSVAWVAHGGAGSQVLVEHRGNIVYTEERRDDLLPAVQAAGALVQFTLKNGALPSVTAPS